MIAIKDMEMPKRCNDCKLRDRHLDAYIVYDSCFLNGKNVDPYSFGKLDRPKWCPLEEIKEKKDDAD